MDSAEARREARRRRILENPESRLRKITGTLSATAIDSVSELKQHKTCVNERIKVQSIVVVETPLTTAEISVVEEDDSTDKSNTSEQSQFAHATDRALLKSSRIDGAVDSIIEQDLDVLTPKYIGTATTEALPIYRPVDCTLNPRKSKSSLTDAADVSKSRHSQASGDDRSIITSTTTTAVQQPTSAVTLLRQYSRHAVVALAAFMTLLINCLPLVSSDDDGTVMTSMRALFVPLIVYELTELAVIRELPLSSTRLLPLFVLFNARYSRHVTFVVSCFGVLAKLWQDALLYLGTFVLLSFILQSNKVVYYYVSLA